MADIRLAAAAIELGASDPTDIDEDPFAGTPEGDHADTDHPRGERRETLEAALGRPFTAGDDPEADPDRQQPGDWKGDPD